MLIHSDEFSTSINVDDINDVDEFKKDFLNSKVKSYKNLIWNVAGTKDGGAIYIFLDKNYDATHRHRIKK